MVRLETLRRTLRANHPVYALRPGGSMMRRNRAVFLGLLVICACGDVNHAAGEYTMSNNRTATSGNDQALPLAAVVTRTDRPAARALPRAPSPTLAAPLAPLPGSALHGGALLRPSGKMSVVRVDLSGGTSHTTYEGAIRQGSCARMGSTIAALVPVSAAASGDGAAVSYAALPTDSLLGRPHILVYGKGGRPESCGAISVSGPIVPVTSAQADSAEASSAG